MKIISSFLLVCAAFSCASCSKESSVVVEPKRTPSVFHKEAIGKPADKNFHYQSYPSGYKDIRFVQYRIYVPQSDGTTKLKIETNFNLRYKFQSGNADRNYHLSIRAANEAVRRLLKQSPKSFPPETKIVKGFILGPGRITFNSAFADKKWWQNQKRAQAAVASLLQTLIETQQSIFPMSGDYMLNLFIAGKPTGRLGRYYVSIPILDAAYIQVEGMKDEKIVAYQRQQYKEYANKPFRPRQ